MLLIAWDLIISDQPCGCCFCLPRILNRYGINPGTRFHNIYGKHIAKKVGNADITFIQVRCAHVMMTSSVHAHIWRSCSCVWNVFLLRSGASAVLQSALSHKWYTLSTDTKRQIKLSEIFIMWNSEIALRLGGNESKSVVSILSKCHIHLYAFHVTNLCAFRSYMCICQ
jgi:hypothetical protein